MNKQTTLPGLSDELEEGEPVFVLRGRDPLTAHMAAMWAALRKGDTASAVVLFADLVSDPGRQYRQPGFLYDAEKVISASDKAKEINEWRAEKGLPFYDLYTVR